MRVVNHLFKLTKDFKLLETHAALLFLPNWDHGLELEYMGCILDELKAMQEGYRDTFSELEVPAYASLKDPMVEKWDDGTPMDAWILKLRRERHKEACKVGKLRALSRVTWGPMTLFDIMQKKEYLGKAWGYELRLDKLRKASRREQSKSLQIRERST